MCVYTCVWVHACHSELMEARGQLRDFFYSFHHVESQRLNLDYQVRLSAGALT